MIIAKSKKKNKTKIFNFFKYYFYLSIIFIVLAVTVFFNLGVWENYKKTFLYKIHSNGIINYIHLPEMLYLGLKKNFYSYEAIYVNLNQKNKIKIETNRLEKLEYVNSTNTPNYKADYGFIKFIEVDASITLRDKTIKTNIRLKGDRSIHYRDPNSSSYKFNIKGSDTFKGAQNFAIQKPRIRNYIHEWIFHEMMGEGNLIKLKYDFLFFYLNGTNLGLYVFEEGFGKEILERNKRREGPIFSAVESFSHDNTLSKMKFDVYNKKKWLSAENLEVTKRGLRNLKYLNNNNGNLEKIFDIKKWAWFFAVSDLTYTEHGAAPKSVKFYFNPITDKIEPIAYDGHRSPRNYSKHLLDFDHRILFDRTQNNFADDFTGLFLEKFFFINKKGSLILNETFYHEYVKALNIITSKEFIDKFFKIRKKEITKISSAIYSDSFVYDDDFRRDSGIGLYYFDKDDFYFRANKIRSILNPKHNLVFVSDDGKNIVIDSSEEVPSVSSKATYFNRYNINFIISELSCDKNKLAETAIIKSKTISLNLRLKYPKHILNKKELGIENSSCNSIVLKSSLDNSESFIEIDKINKNFDSSNIDEDLYKKYFVEVDKNLYLERKVTLINENLLIPKNLNVIIKEGEKIILSDNAFIFSNSPWQIGGDYKITYIEGRADNLGGGIIIHNTNKISKISNVKFSHLTGLVKNKLKKNFVDNLIILGSINFYEANVELSKVEFNEIYSEDAINIFRSDFKIQNVNINKSFSDAIDIDFSNGEIKASKFKDIGNDGIDLSGSNVEITGISFENIGDKMISVGEESNANILNINGTNAYVGIVSKDGSITKVKNADLEKVIIGFSSYQKKSSYNFGVLILEDVVVKNDYVKYLTDKDSIIKFNGDNAGVKSDKILEIIYDKNLDILEDVRTNQG